MSHPLLAHYPYRPDSYDELIGDEDVRPHWQAFVDHIEETGTDTLRGQPDPSGCAERETAGHQERPDARPMREFTCPRRPGG